MKINKMLLGFTLFLIAIFLLLAVINNPVKAETASFGPEISKKLDEVLKNQKEILQGIASVRQDLEVIKIRVTR